MPLPRPASRWLVPLAIGVLTAAPGLPAAAAELTAEIGAQGRWFPQDPLRPDQQGSIVSVRFEPAFYHDWESGRQRLAVWLFGRWDSGDEKRTHADVREAYWRRTFGDSFDLYVGIRKVFWGVTETVHLVDIINQTDFVDNIDTEQKLGQPMVQGALIRDWGTIDLFLMPYFRERTFPGPKGRPGLPLPVDTDRPIYESGAGDTHLDAAVRWSHYLGDFDLGIAYFNGTDRLPRFAPALQDSQAVLLPVYELMQRISLDGQWTRDAWLWKLETALRDKAEVTSFAAVGGFEYTLYGIFQSVLDLGLILEYQYDDRPEQIPSNNDLAFGGRLTLNDVNDTALLAFASVDLDHGTTFASVEGSRRLGAGWVATLEARMFFNADPSDVIYSFRDDDYVQLEFTRFIY